MTALITAGVGTIAALLVRRKYGSWRDEYEDLMEELAGMNASRRNLETKLFDLQQRLKSLDQQAGQVRERTKEKKHARARGRCKKTKCLHYPPTLSPLPLLPFDAKKMYIEPTIPRVCAVKKKNRCRAKESRSGSR